ncbi:hypothetical protein [Methylobacter sp.]|uniref:hypothetical protein n=1 Tax=Methylobacter sp. TaxID=2051955 RepID=UPI002489D9D6|nr:hypothetical protein [Methylobacter sp.]MDI1278639.1 hypothetical protein [Methylobacter sp.]MDI1359459.1 hypothetical protein [Methylobacter sp.]
MQQVKGSIDQVNSSVQQVNSSVQQGNGILSQIKDALNQVKDALTVSTGDLPVYTGAGRFYTSTGETVDAVATDFLDKATNSPLLKAGRDVFDVPFPAGGGCSDCDLSIPAVMGMMGITLFPFCASWMPGFWSIIAAALKVVTVFMAVRIMITPTF